MNPDISSILQSWEYDPDNCIRIIKMTEGREVLQVRQPLGIEQYELEGRPDGKKILGKDTFLDEYQEKLETYKDQKNTDEGFLLTHNDIRHLMSEGVLYYYRYLLLFQLGEFERTAKDTDHNLRIFDMVERYTDNQQDKNNMLQYRPYVMRINAISNAMISLKHNLKYVAREILLSAINLLDELPEIDTPEFRFEKTRSINYLKSTLKQIEDETDKEAVTLEQLTHELDRAVEVENYERAAELRDRIKELEKQKEKENSKKT